jgi:ATP-dependent Clp protease ATP-binding subunit ClpA
MRVLSRRRSAKGHLARPSPVVAELFVRAQHEAIAFRHDWIGTEHVLLALLADGSNPTARALRRLGLEAEPVRRELQSILGEAPPAGVAFDAEALDRAQRSHGRCGPSFGVAPRLKQALDRSRSEAERHGREITAGDVLVGLSEQRDSVAAHQLDRHEVTPEMIRVALRREHAADA